MLGIKDTISMLFQALFRHEVKNKLENISDNEVKKSNLDIESLQKESQDLSDSETKVQTEESHKNSELDNEISESQATILRIDNKRSEIKNSTSRKVGLLSSSDKIAEIENKLSDNQNDLIVDELTSIDDRVKLGLELIEHQIGDDKVPRNLRNRINSIKSSIDFTARKIVAIKDERENRDRELSKLSKESKSDINESERSSLKELDLKEQSERNLISWLRNKRDSLSQKTRQTLNKISSSKRFIDNKINNSKQRVKEFSDRMSSGLDSLIYLPAALREVSLFTLMLGNLVTENKPVKAIGEIGKSVIDVITGGSSNARKVAAKIDTQRVTEKGAVDLYGTVDKLDPYSSEFSDDKSAQAGLSYIKGKLAEKLGSEENVEKFRKAVKTLNASIDNPNLSTIGNWLSKLPGVKSDTRHYEQFVNLGVLNTSEYNELMNLSKSPSSNSKRLSELRNIIAARVNELGKTFKRSEPKIPRKSNVTDAGVSLGPIKESTIQNAYELANSTSAFKFDPLVTSITDNASGRSENSTHKYGRAIDLRLGETDGNMSDKEAIERTKVLGSALQSSLKSEGILEDYRIVSHKAGWRDKDGKVKFGAPHFHLEYLGDKGKNQTGDFVNTSVDLGDLPKDKIKRSQAGHIRIDYPSGPNDEIIDIGVDGRQRKGGKTTSWPREVNNETPKKVNRESGDPNDNSSTESDKLMTKALLLRMNSMESNLSQLIYMSAIKDSNDLDSMLVTPRRFI